MLFFSLNPHLLAHLPTEFCIPSSVSHFYPPNMVFFFLLLPGGSATTSGLLGFVDCLKRPFFCVSPIHLMTSPSLPFNVRYGFRMEISEASFTRADFSMYSFSAVAKRS